MQIIDHPLLTHVLLTYGYYAVFFVVMLESAGVPMPGETILVTASIYAGTKRGLDIRMVIAAAAAGAIIGDNIGYWVARRFGVRLLERVGPRIGLDARKQKLGRYLFKNYGGPIVFFGRFVAFLRAYAAVLAGVNRLRFTTFLFYNAVGGIVWALIMGIGGHLVGQSIESVAGPIGYAALAAAVIGSIVLWRFYKSHEEMLLEKAEKAMDEEDALEQRRHSAAQA